MLEGTLIAESLRLDHSLDDLTLTLKTITRHQRDDASPDQPHQWTEIDFEIDEAHASHLAERLAEVLDQPGWYADFRSETETWVVFPQRVFRYPRGETTGRTQAQEHGSTLGVPDHQLDWPI